MSNHQHAYLICENKCLVKGIPKTKYDSDMEEIDERFDSIAREIADGSVTTAKIADSAVTDTKLGNNIPLSHFKKGSKTQSFDINVSDIYFISFCLLILFSFPLFSHLLFLVDFLLI